MDENNLEKVEIRLSYLEDYMKQLNEVVLEQGRHIAVLESEQQRLKTQLDEISDHLPGPESSKPPHY